MSDISSRNAEQPYELSRGTHITRRQALRTMAASSMALAGGAALAACGGTSSPSGPTDLTMWINPAVPEVAAPPSNWFLYSTVRKELNINLKVVLLPLGNDGVTKMSALQQPTTCQIFSKILVATCFSNG